MMEIFTSKLTTLVFMLIAATFSTQASEILIADDFSTDTMAVDSRIRLDSQTWVKHSSSGWATSGGVLSNTLTGASIASEGATGQTYLVGAGNASLNRVTVSFDYNVGLDSDLYFNLIGGFENGTPGASENLHNVGTTNGSIQDNIDNQYADWNLISLLDGHGGANQAQEFAAGTSGTFNQTFNLFAHDTGEGHTFNNLSDYSILTVSFIRNDTGVAGTGVVLDNFSLVAIPEPSSLALIMMGGVLLARAQRKGKESKTTA